MMNSSKFYLFKEIARKLQKKFDIVLHYDVDESINANDFSDRDFFCTIDSGDNVLIRRHGCKETIMIRDYGYSLDERSLTDDYEEAMEKAIRKLLDQ